MLYTENAPLTLTDARDAWDWEWIGHPRSFAADHPLSIGRRELVVVARIDDDTACYSFDDWALVKLGADYYLLQTSGCSCPSPTENAGVVEGPCTLDQIAERIESSIKNDQWGIVFRQAEQFRGMITFARSVS
jgi:hypothetical protein